MTVCQACVKNHPKIKLEGLVFCRLEQRLVKPRFHCEKFEPIETEEKCSSDQSAVVS